MTYPVAIRSTGLGWGLGVGRVGSIVGPAVGGWLLATAANPRSVYAFCVVPVVIGMAAVAALARYGRPVAAPVIARDKEQVP
jgi:AAHS family 4-hydroxybenzoate transporter-like MFS transporter